MLFKRINILLIVLIFIPTIAFAANKPVIFFSDLTSGPKTGWEGSTTKGAAVTIWGEGFGSNMYQKDPNNNYVSVGGVKITEYAEWGENLGPARNLDRITFWLHSGVPDGDTYITVTVNGVTSNSIPFTVRNGNIYFISVNGSDSNDGKYATNKQNGHGPWRHFYMIDPERNKMIKPGVIIYVRKGNYTNYDESPFIIYYREASGLPGKPISAVGYPGEWPEVGDSNDTREAICSYTHNEYLEWHKIVWKNGVGAISLHNGPSNIRIVGNIFKNSQKKVMSGVLYADHPRNHKVYGNLFYNNGYDKFKHDLYYKAWSDKYQDFPDAFNIDIGWNEFRKTYTNPNVSVDKKGGPSFSFSTDGNTAKFYNSTIHDNLWIDCSDSAILIDSNSKNITIYNNIIINCSNNPGYRSVVYLGGPEHSNIIPDGVDNIVYFYNNIIYDSGNKNGMISNHQNNSKLILKNNIFYSVNDLFFNINTSAVNNIIISDNNIFYGGDVKSLYNSDRLIITNSVLANPKFVNITNHDFHLQSNSPAIDAGVSLSKVIIDFEGNPRPMDGDGDGVAKPDIGAFEYTGTYIPPQKDTTPPSSPTLKQPVVK